MEEGTGVSSGSHDSSGGGSAEQDETDNGGDGGLFQSISVREPELFLPIANISRIMRRILPANAKVAKEAKVCVQECVTEFIGFITSEANDICLKEKRKTISGDDVICAMTTLGFENYVEILKVYLHQYRELEGDVRSVPEPNGKDDEGGTASLPKNQL